MDMVEVLGEMGDEGVIEEGKALMEVVEVLRELMEVLMDTVMIGKVPVVVVEALMLTRKEQMSEARMEVVEVLMKMRN